MKNFFALLFRALKAIWRSRFRWLAVLFFVWLYRVEFMPDAGGNGFAKALQVGCLLGMLVMLLRWRPNLFQYCMSRAGGGIPSVMWLYCFAVLSTLWAFNPQFALFLSFQNLVIVMLLTYAFALCRSWREMELVFVVFISCVMLFESVAVRLSEHSLFVHLLPSGSTSAMLMTYCFAEWINVRRNDVRRARVLWRAMVLSAVVLVLSTSGGANASAVFGLGVGLFFSRKRVYAVLLMLAGLMLYLNQELLDNILLTLMPGKNMKTIETGNGRDTIWETIFRLHAQRPWFGWGFACVERVDQLNVIQGQSLSDAHNSYIGILGSLGYAGCCFLAVHLYQHVTCLWHRLGQTGYHGLFAATCCALMNGYTYGYLSGKACSITVTYFCLVVLAFTYGKRKNVRS